MGTFLNFFYPWKSPIFFDFFCFCDYNFYWGLIIYSLFMASKSTNHLFDPFKDKRTNFDTITAEINSKTIMKDIEKVVEEKRKDIFDILSTSRANWNDDVDEKSLEKMQRALNEKKKDLEEHLWEVTTNLNLLKDDNSDLVKYCKSILDTEDPAKVDTALAWECGNLLSTLQNVYTKWSRKEKLFSGKKDDASDDFADLIEPDVFSDIINAPDEATLQAKIDEFVKKTFSPRDNSFWIAKSKLYMPPKSAIEQAKVAARIAIFLHCMKKALEEWRIDKAKTTKVKSILKQLKDEQIPKIRWLYNLKKEKEAVDAEYETLLDIRKNDKTPIDRKDTTTSIDLTSSFEGKSTDKAKEIDFYNLNKNWIKITIGTNTYPTSDIVLKDSSWETQQLNKMKGASWDYTLSLKVSWSEVKLWELCINYNDPKKALFVLRSDPNIVTNLSAKWITWDVNVEIPIMAVKNVGTPRTRTGQVSLTRTIKALLKGSTTPIPTPFTLEAQRERETTITNVDQVNRAIAQREADEELRERYRNVGWNIFDRANLFLRRKFIKDKIVSRKMRWKKWIDWSESWQSAAHRHQIEKQENLADNLQNLVDIDHNNYPATRAQLDNLIDRFTWKNSTPPRQWWISETDFQTEFSHILNKSGIDFDDRRPTSATIANWKPISKIIKSNNLDSLSTNILLQAKQFQAHQKMVYDIREHIIANPTEADTAFDTRCRWEIGSYISTYDDIPDFLHQMKLSIDKVDDIKTLKWHEAALLAIQGQSLKYRLQILNNGWEVYNVEKKGWLLTKIWRFLDDPTGNSRFFREHPNLKEAIWWIRWGTKMAGMIGVWLALAPTGPLGVAAWVGGMSAITTLFKKKAHYERENRSYQRMQATNLTDYRNKRTNIANDVAWMKWYQGRFRGPKKRARKQFRDYVLTTQDQLASTNQLLIDIKTNLNKWTVLTAWEKNDLAKLLADWLARLDYHKETGQNFLWSDNPGIAEKEYKQLQNAIIWWTLRLWIKTGDLRNLPYKTYYDSVKKVIDKWTGTGDEYNTQWYSKARKRFRRRSNIKAWVWALKAGAISFGLSYLASSLASHRTRRHIVDIEQDMHNWKVWWEYNLWDAQEHLLVTWDVNPTMNSVITADTHRITWASIYSSVDSASCSVAKWAHELSLAQADLSSTFSSSPFSGNSAWELARDNFINEARSKIWNIPGVSEWNRQLALARAIEWWNEGILKPAIASWNASMWINSSAIHRVDWWIQSSAWAAWQGFRNMWLVSIDYVNGATEEVVEHFTKAIPIPVPSWSNTFWAPKSDPK